MQTASLENSKKLFAVSGWHDVEDCWDAGNSLPTVYHQKGWYDENITSEEYIPAYGLSYLARKLPKKRVIKKKIYGFVLTPATSDGSWIADYYSGGWDYFDDNRSRENWLHFGDKAKLTEADTPEDATAQLCIALFEAGILKTRGLRVMEGNIMSKLPIEVQNHEKKQGFWYASMGEVSDGYHTFNELYDHRIILFIGLAKSHADISWKAIKHADGTSMDGWFIAGMHLPTGDITYHLPEDAWDKLDGVEALTKAPEWDGHTPADVVARLTEWLAEYE